MSEILQILSLIFLAWIAFMAGAMVSILNEIQNQIQRIGNIYALWQMDQEDDSA